MMFTRRAILGGGLALPIAATLGVPLLLLPEVAKADDFMVRIRYITQTQLFAPLYISASHIAQMIADSLNELYQAMAANLRASYGSISGAWSEIIFQSGTEMATRPFDPHNVGQGFVTTLGVSGLINYAMGTQNTKDGYLTPAAIMTLAGPAMVNAVIAPLFQELLIVHLVMNKKFNVGVARWIAFTVVQAWQGVLAAYLTPKLYNKLLQYFRANPPTQYASDKVKLDRAQMQPTVDAGDFGRRLLSQTNDGNNGFTFSWGRQIDAASKSASLVAVSTQSIGGSEYQATGAITNTILHDGSTTTTGFAKWRSRKITVPLSAWGPSGRTVLWRDGHEKTTDLLAEVGLDQAP